MQDPQKILQKSSSTLKKQNLDSTKYKAKMIKYDEKNLYVSARVVVFFQPCDNFVENVSSQKWWATINDSNFTLRHMLKKNESMGAHKDLCINAHNSKEKGK